MKKNEKKIRFGKHKGLSLEEIAKIDRSYLVWLSSNTKDSGLYMKLRKILNR